MDQSNAILKSWEVNAVNWIATIDNEEIESRKLVTNAAILETILQLRPKRIIDIGCGEGWLTRALQQKGIEAYGIDAIASLIDNAIKKGGPFYSVGTYSQIVSNNVLPSSRFDSAVINFALIDKEETDALITSIHQFLKKDGWLFIQTLHPFSVASTDAYQTGWKEGSWNGMKQNFVLPYQWYFRTLEDWCQLFRQASLTIHMIKEPIHPETKKPLSIIFVLRA